MKHRVNFTKFLIITGFVAFVAAVTISLAGRASEGGITRETDKKLAEQEFYKKTDGSSKAIFNVEGMSCSGCIFTIKSSLSEFKGINEILVDVAAGKAEIYFDDTKLKDVNQIATVITASGYPAKIYKIETAEQVKKNLDFMATRARLYIASVGGLDISRNDLDSELEYAKKRYSKNYGEGMFATDRGKALLNRLKGQIVSRLINEGIQLQEIQKARFKVDKITVDKELDEFLSKKGMKLEDFKTALKENGLSFDRFMKRFEIRVLVKQYLDSEVFSGGSNDIEKQQLYSTWFNNAKLLAKVVYYDKDLEGFVRNRSSGCGSSCSNK
jgi:copper chaperone CopZ